MLPQCLSFEFMVCFRLFFFGRKCKKCKCTYQETDEMSNKEWLLYEALSGFNVLHFRGTQTHI